VKGNGTLRHQHADDSIEKVVSCHVSLVAYQATRKKQEDTPLVERGGEVKEGCGPAGGCRGLGEGLGAAAHRQ